MTNKTFVTSVWHNGSPNHETGAGFGVSINIAGRKIFKQIFGLQASVKVELRIDGNWFVVKTAKTFWTTCPELRKKEIGAWLIANKRNLWESGKPTQICVTHLGDNRFDLALC